MPRAAGEAVELGHDERVALAREVERRLQLRALLRCRDLLCEDLLAAGRLEITMLSIKAGVLLGRRCAALPDQDAMHGDYPRSVR
jgi:hypothetical protein